MKGLIFLRDIATDDEGRTVPVVPATWTVLPEAGDWYSLWPLGREERPDVFFHAWLALNDGIRGVFAVIASDAILRALRDSSARTWTLRELRDDDSTAAQQIKAAWVDERPRLYDEEGNDLGPDPAYSPIGLYRRGMAGWDHAGDLEATEDQP